MAIFNPDVPGQAPPDFVSLSKPISPYEGDKSFGNMLKGAGDILKTAVTGVDDVFKAVIDTGLRKDLETERDATTGALETMAGLPGNQKVSPLQPDMNVLADSRPPQLEGLDRAVTGAVNGAKAKPSMTTYYTGKLDMIAKDYRSQYPGYADYIDQRVASITGGNPANERLKDLMTMVQTAGTTAKADQDKAMTFLGQHMKDPDSQQTLAAVMGGVPNPLAYVMNATAKWRQIENQVEQATKVNTLESSNNQILSARMEKDATSVANKNGEALWTSMDTGIKMRDGKMGTPDRMNQLALDVSLGKVQMDSAEGMKYGQALMAMGETARQKTLADFNREDKDGNSIAKYINNPEKLNKLADISAQRFTIPGQMFLNKDHGAAFDATRATEAHIADTGRWLFEESDMKEHARLNSVITKNLGPAAGGIMGAEILKSDKIDKITGQFVDFQTKRLAMTPNVSLESVIKELKEKKIGMDPTRPGERSMYTFLTKDLPLKLADPRLDASGRQQLSMNLFSGDVVSQFQKDSIDDKGNAVPGQHAIFRDMTDTKVRDAVWNLSGGNAQNPIWVGYKNWISTQNNILLRGTVKDLNALKEYPYSDIRDDRSQSYLKFNWDNKNYQMSVTDTNPRKDLPQVPVWPFDGARAMQKMELPKNVAFLNNSLKPVVEAALKEGTDPNAAVVRTLRTLGFNPNGTGLEADIMKSVMGPAPEAKPSEKAPASTPAAPVYDTPAAVNRVIKDVAKGAVKFIQNPILPSLPPKAMTTLGEMTTPITNFAPEENNSLQSFVANPDKSSKAQPKSKNVSDQDIFTMTKDDIPDGMSISDFLKSLKSKK